ncbi:MAG TPA: phosphoenolpyruvate carboxylase, partial [Caballeronia sp.]|nr:phosphoenolpyruvate carboxylase [Caballeronia sp.]
MTSPGSARNARPRRNAVSKDASSAVPATAPAVRSRAATVAKASKTAVSVKTAAAGTTKRVANGRAAAAVLPAPAPAEIVKNGKAPKAPSRARDNKDHPLFEDIRYLGRLLGDVVREQEGDEVFAVVETIRQTAVKFRREEDNEASQTLEKRLKSLSPEQTVSVVRAFSYFSHLANIAEDRHHNRRRRIHALAGSAPQPGTMAYAIERLKASPNAKNTKSAKATLQKFFDNALIVPVLTAHPTEVSRKSILDAQHEVARLLAERDQELTARERAHNEAMLRSRVTSLWQTRMLRDARLTVADEIENALSYYHATFLEEIPALYADIEDALAEHGLPARLPPFLQMGSWIGGDRDGNPNVTAPTL